jgi:hypothetical protein
MEPHVDALGVEAVPTARDAAACVAILELAQAHRALLVIIVPSLVREHGHQRLDHGLV